MPARPRWFTEIPEIVTVLEAIDTPVIDRAGLERIFRVRRRRATQLMRAFGGYQAGRTYLVDRMRLIAQLREIAGSNAFAFELRRRQRLTESLEAVRPRRAAAITIGTAAELAAPPLPPAGVQLSPGTLRIDFNQPIDLLQKLFQLSQMITANYDWFEASAKRDCPVPQEKPHPFPG